MTKLTRGLLLSAGGGAALYVGLAAWSGFHRVEERLLAYRWSTAVAALVLASLNYLLRFAKWEYFLRRLSVKVPPARSLGIFLSGFALTVTPGKIGEVVKSYLLRESDGVPMATTAPIVVAERVTDLIGCLLLIALSAGALWERRLLILVAVCLALVAGLVLAVAFPSLAEFGISLVARLPAVGKMAPKLREFYASTRVLLGPAPLLVATLISSVAWACECAAFYVILGGFPTSHVASQGAGHAALQTCTFIYATMTIAGALSFLPGGLGVQEGGMVGLLVATTPGLDEPTAFAATFLTRLCTLWFAVLVGVVALTQQQRRTALDLSDLKKHPPDEQRKAVDGP